MKRRGSYYGGLAASSLVVAAAVLGATGVPRVARAAALLQATTRPSPYAAVTGVTVRLSSTTSGGTGVTYTVGLATSSSGALVADAGSVTFEGPPGTVFTSQATVEIPGSHVPAAPAPTVLLGAGASIATATVPFDVPANTQLTVTLSGVQNAPSSGPQQLLVWTSSDVEPVTATYPLQGSPTSGRAVSDLSLATSSDAAGADDVNWSVSFTVPAGGGLVAGSSDVFFRAPPGTRFEGSASITDLTSGQSGGGSGATGTFGVLGGGSVGQLAVPITVRAGDKVVVTPIVSNPAAGAGQLFVSTSADPDWSSVPVQTVPASRVSDLQLSPSSLSGGASDTTLTVKFVASPSGGLVAGQARLFLEGPPGTVFLAEGDVTDTTTKASGGFNGTYGTGGTYEGGRLLSALLPIAVHPGDGVEVQVREANPGPGAGQYSLTTTSDRIPATAAVTFSQPTSVRSPRVTLTTAAGTTTFHITFRTSSQGSLVANQGQIEVLGPPGTVFDPSLGTVADETSGASFGPGTLTDNAGPTWGAEANWLPFYVPFDVGAGDEVAITGTLATPPAGTSSGGFVVETSSDTAPARAAYTASGRPTTPPVTAARADCGGSVAAGASGLTCTVRFTVPAGGALAAGTGTISVVGPAAFAISNNAAEIDDLTTHAGAAVNTINLLGIGSSSGNIATFVTPVAVAGGDTVQLTLDDVALPPDAGPVSLSIATSADAAPATVQFTTKAVGGLSISSAGESSQAPGASGVTYTTVFRASGTGGLAAGSGTVNLLGPPGVDFSQVNGAVLTDLTTHESKAASLSAAPGGAPLVELTAPIPVAAGDQVKIVVTGVGNPPLPFTGGFTLTTSSDGFVTTAPAGPRPTNRWVSTIASSLATPSEAFLPAKSIPANLGIAGLLAVFLSWPSSLFNQTFKENNAAIVDWWERRTRRLRRRRWFRRLAEATRGRRAPAERPAGKQVAERAAEVERSEEPGELRTFAAVFVAGALLASLNDPTFLTSVRSLVTFPSVAVSMALSVALPALVGLAYHRRRYKAAPWRWHALPTGLAVAAACVLFSRATHFEPGYLYGIVLGVAFTRKLARVPQGHVAFLTTVATLVIAVAAWFGWVPVSEAANAHPASVGLGFADDVLAMMFVGGLVGSFFALIPIRTFSGFSIRHWDFRAWISLYLVEVFLIVQVLLRPVTRANLTTSHAPLVGTVVAFAVAAVASVAFFEHFENKRRTEESPGKGEPSEPVGRLRHLFDAAFKLGDDEEEEEEPEELDDDAGGGAADAEAAPAGSGGGTAEVAAAPAESGDESSGGTAEAAAGAGSGGESSGGTAEEEAAAPAESGDESSGTAESAVPGDSGGTAEAAALGESGGGSSGGTEEEAAAPAESGDESSGTAEAAPTA